MAMPRSCDTFVVLPPLTHNGVVFGKNSDRPQGEVQEVVYFPASQSSDLIQCTYIEVDSSGFTKAVILSKPGWMWGAEMGANECGVVIGNEAVWTNNNDGEHDPNVKRLLGMDLVRLGLERSCTAYEALEIITQLLAKYGQGGSCSPDELWSYHNSFLIADPSCAWVLETSGKHWAAEQITSGFKNISNVLTITTKIDKMSDGLLDYAKQKRLWNGRGDFDFRKAFGFPRDTDCERLDAGKLLLEELTLPRNFKQTDMFTILRDEESGICMPSDGMFSTQGSQVSVLTSNKRNVHWFTATPDPSKSIFKPFIFTQKIAVSDLTRCPKDRTNIPYPLYSLHAKAIKNNDHDKIQKLARNLEAEWVKKLDVIANVDDDLSELDGLFKDCLENEVKLYGS